MITWARRGGGRPDVLEKITHNAAEPHHRPVHARDWEPLCEAVLCLDYAGMAPARPPRAVQPATESQPIVVAAPAGGPLQAPVL
jgi:hypothetical protein